MYSDKCFHADRCIQWNIWNNPIAKIKACIWDVPFLRVWIAVIWIALCLFNVRLSNRKHLVRIWERSRFGLKHMVLWPTTRLEISLHLLADIHFFPPNVSLKNNWQQLQQLQQVAAFSPICASFLSLKAKLLLNLWDLKTAFVWQDLLTGVFSDSQTTKWSLWVCLVVLWIQVIQSLQSSSNMYCPLRNLGYSRGLMQRHVSTVHISTNPLIHRNVNRHYFILATGLEINQT